MVRSTAIAWKFRLAVTALALQFWQSPALADEGSAQQVETQPQPLEPKAVPITLLPPASDAAVASWRQWRVDGAPRTGGAPILTMRPAEKAAIALPRPEQLEAAPVIVQPAETAPTVQPRPEQVEAATKPYRSSCDQPRTPPSSSRARSQRKAWRMQRPSRRLRCPSRARALLSSRQAPMRSSLRHVRNRQKPTRMKGWSRPPRHRSAPHFARLLSRAKS